MVQVQEQQNQFYRKLLYLRSFNRFLPSNADKEKTLKGGVSRDFLPLFLHNSNPSGPLTKRHFRILFLFYRDIQIKQKKLCGVHITAESNSTVCIIPQCQENKMSQKAPRYASYCRVTLRGVKIELYDQKSQKCPLLGLKIKSKCTDFYFFILTEYSITVFSCTIAQVLGFFYFKGKLKL